MPAARTVLAVLSLAAVAVLASSCVSVLGLDEEHDSAVEKLCKCEAVAKLKNDSYDECVAYFTKRLNAASEPARAKWMEMFDRECSKDCTRWASCVALPATCTLDSDCLDANCADCCGEHLKNQCLPG
jgi:hypothetical protein